MRFVFKKYPTWIFPVEINATKDGKIPSRDFYVILMWFFPPPIKSLSFWLLAYMWECLLMLVKIHEVTHRKSPILLHFHREKFRSDTFLTHLLYMCTYLLNFFLSQSEFLFVLFFVVSLMIPFLYMLSAI